MKKIWKLKALSPHAATLSESPVSPVCKPNPDPPGFSTLATSLLSPARLTDLLDPFLMKDMAEATASSCRRGKA